ncbi:MAG: hypothetical protein IH861_03235 [Chloroflexi bacterium]|nr:hypothetical protein [Chloroflexota bacterium]
MRLARRPVYIVGALVLVVAATGILGAAYFLGIFDPHSGLALDTFNLVYGTEGSRLDTCETCHTSRKVTNAYGYDLKPAFEGKKLTAAEAMEQLQVMIKTIEELDSDGDGYSNIEEVTARTFPGNPDDHPLASP